MKEISTQDAPAAIGPYAQAVCAGNLVYCSGQIAFDPATGALVGGGIAEQTRQALANLAAVLAAGGASLQSVVKTTVYLADMNDFAGMNTEYARVFGGCRPARATVEVSRLPVDALVEIECVAEVS